MASRYLGSTSLFPRTKADMVGAASGGTLAGSQTVQIVFDDVVYGATNEGKERLINAVMAIEATLKSVKSWPLTTSI